MSGTDLISRRDAIAAIETGKKNHGDFLTSSFVGYEMAEKIVKALPSAQPEIIHCRECKRYVKAIRNLPNRCNRIEGLNMITEDSFCSWAERRTDG